MSHFIPLYVRFSPEKIYFVTVSISFILNEFLYIVAIFRDFSKIPVSGFTRNLSPRNS